MCDHGPRVYKSRLGRDGILQHLWDCAGEEGQCPEQQITRMKEVK